MPAPAETLTTPPFARPHVPLAPYTTFGIGGPARWFARATSEDEVLAACAWALETGVPLFVLGGGSNVLIADAGFPGLVLHMALAGVEQGMQRGESLFSVGAGEDWDAFVDRAVNAGCAGVECLAGIPGTVGGTPVQNVGAYGQEVAEIIRSVRCLDRETLRFMTFSAAECQFAYRSSRFNQGADQGRYIVTQVQFALRQGEPPLLEYADLRRWFADKPQPGLIETAAAVRAIRAAKGMVIPAGPPAQRDPDTRSAGSFFKNPVIPQQQYEQLVRAHPGMPGYPVSGQSVPQRKLPAAWLLEQSGFPRGYALGRAALSSRHTLALTNQTGDASAAEILALRDHLAAGVQRRFGVTLEPEPVLVGFHEAAGRGVERP